MLDLNALQIEKHLNIHKISIKYSKSRLASAKNLHTSGRSGEITQRFIFSLLVTNLGWLGLRLYVIGAKECQDFDLNIYAVVGIGTSLKREKCSDWVQAQNF